MYAGLGSSAQQEFAMQNTATSIPVVEKIDTATVNSINRLAVSYIQKDLDSIHYYAEMAMSMARQLNYEHGMAEAYLGRCVYNRMKGNTHLALDEGLRGLEIFERSGDRKGIAYACMQIAQVYKEFASSDLLDEYLGKGIEFANRATQIYESLNDSSALATSLNVAGIIYRDRGKIAGQEYYYDSAFKCYERGIEIVKRCCAHLDEYPLARLYNNISQIYTIPKRDYTTALRYSQMAVEINKRLNNLNSLTHNYMNIADIYRRMGKPAEGLPYAILAKDISMQLNSPTRIGNAYGMLSSVYRSMKRYDSALHYFQLADHISDSFANISKSQMIAEMQTRFETEQKESEIERLGAVNAIKNKQIQYLVGGLVLFGLLAAAMVLLYRRVNKQKELITRQTKQLEVMMKELHHRVKNNLQIVSSLLSLQTYRLKDEESIAAIRESQQRVQAMSFIHQRLYKTDQLTSVNIREYITDLTESLLASYGYDRDGFDLQIVVENEIMDVDKALPIGLIVNEIVTNAFKYAYHDVKYPSLHITCTEDGNDINLIIKDNGAGLDEAKWKQSGGSFGKQLVTTLCRQLRAKQTLEVNNGTCFQFVIPKNLQAA